MTASDHLGLQFGVYIPPERVHSVQMAMPPVFVGTSQVAASGTGPGDRPTADMGKRGRDQMHIANRVASDIMASDIPTEHLKGITHIKTGQRLRPGTSAQYRASVHDSRGFIQHGDKYGAENRADREVRRRTLVHEIGHHQDPETHDRSQSQGRVEARAENYADHFIGATKTAVPSVYDNPKNIAIAGYQRTLYSKTRVRT